MHLSDRLRRILSRAMIGVLAAALVFAAVAFGAVTVDLLAGLYAFALVLALLWAVKLLLARSVSWKQAVYGCLPIGAGRYSPAFRRVCQGRRLQRSRARWNHSC